MSGKKYSEEHKILFYETDCTRRVTVGMLVNIMMLASQDQSNELGVTVKKVKGLGLGWVITQHLIEIKRMPQIYEKVNVITEAASYNRYFCYRDFWIKSENGEELAKMHSVFVLMDQNKRKIARILPELIEPYSSEYTKKIERLPEPEKLSSDEQGRTKNYQVRFMDIDSNEHVNNVHYFDWMMDALPSNFLLNHSLKKMNIKYKQEVHYGDTVESRAYIDENDQEIKTVHQIKTEQDLCCTASCEWLKNN
ncbi:acyl-[acyl-carrier-protein] thioesterase [Liquorilactobacillus uvarum]|uniref:Acyl-acyl carrier protein thioesterase n=1 Tax=Liquorilactobacillus uvarum DSM 19971 TaxID=1423812 RepID=A0A0R1QDI1_9LACO|nr:acyl-ACP thioesterase domain-containing protein [Liquorilactobacillus uvarum]KRL38904.1 acyl-acyl carrier protein thioesterase [Liquorilactobacillus uvarum DSM 19971]